MQPSETMFVSKVTKKCILNIKYISKRSRYKIEKEYGPNFERKSIIP